MRALIRFFAKLYPPRWRRRYGAEFDTLLDDTSADAKTALNVFIGAISMQIRTWNVGKILAAAGLAGIIVAMGIALNVRKVYVSTSVVKITSSSPQETSGHMHSLARDVLSRASLTQTIAALDLYPRERSKMPLEDVIDRMQRNIQVLPISSAGSTTIPAFAVQFNYADPLLAQKATNDLTSKFIEGNLRQPSGSMTLEVLDPASRPENPVFPNKPVIAFAGLLGGLALGGIFAVVLRLTRPKPA